MTSLPRREPITKRHFEDKGAEYAFYRPTYPTALAAALADLTPTPITALDVGCGNGQFSVLLAEHFEQVLASDVSEDQIANARPHPKVRYSVGSAEDVAAANNSADLITAAQAAHWFNLEPFYAEARRATKPDAVLALITYGVLSAEGPAAARINAFYWDEIHKHWPQGREHVETGYRDFAFPFEPVAVPELNIERQWTAAEFINYCQTWSSVKRAEKAGDGHLLKEFERDLLEVLGPDTVMRIQWPISIRAGRL